MPDSMETRRARKVEFIALFRGSGLTLREAAERCVLTRSTMKSYVDGGGLPGERPLLLLRGYMALNKAFKDDPAGRPHHICARPPDVSGCDAASRHSLIPFPVRERLEPRILHPDLRRGHAPISLLTAHSI
ncbi:hypothetical protein BB934_45600 (plasmid) [Microvirga ossetica]|uniref:Uncharacterized protein n=1 Tax=Microvirga ossetica TaxID=1882682 RepID=A0A1B2EZZ7_9HYPH|nr:hypothetical protein [Microvirga ossetica]ANY85498.1 hypothetical protein BB934_45600 [Microvirga ossetica]